MKSKKEHNKLLINNQVISYTHSISLSEQEFSLSFFNKIKLLFNYKLSSSLILYFNEKKVVNTNLIVEVKK
jgi:hypothetical protein